MTLRIDTPSSEERTWTSRGGGHNPEQHSDDIPLEERLEMFENLLQNEWENTNFSNTQHLLQMDWRTLSSQTLNTFLEMDGRTLNSQELKVAYPRIKSILL